jgi:hypothetical protein
MKRIVSLCLIVTLLGSTAAASAQTSAGFSTRSHEYWLAYAGKLPIGSTVRVRTTDGKRLTAILAIVDSTGITLESKTRVPEPPRHIPFDQLSRLELKKKESSVAQRVAIGVATGAGTFFAIFLIMLAAYED